MVAGLIALITPIVIGFLSSAGGVGEDYWPVLHRIWCVDGDL